MLPSFLSVSQLPTQDLAQKIARQISFDHFQDLWNFVMCQVFFHILFKGMSVKMSLALHRDDCLDENLVVEIARQIADEQAVDLHRISLQVFEHLHGLDLDFHLNRRTGGLSRDIAAAVGVRHESPQVLILRDGHVAWHGSHWRVTQDAVRDALAAASSPSVGQGVAG